METKPATHVRRRTFLQNTAIASAATTLPTLAPSSVLGANDRLNLGIIGSGGRGRGLMRDFLNFNCRFLGVNDVYSISRERGMEIAGEDATAYATYQELLENPEIDAVIIATPEHQHGVQLIDAVNAGKDVYCEKPMSHSIEEGNRMVQAVRATDRIVQIGMQRRSSPSVHAARDVITSGQLGSVYTVKAIWNWNVSQPMNYGEIQGDVDWEQFCHPSPVAPMEPARFYNWRVFWDYSGGHVCDQGTHLMDVVQWFMQSGTPHTAECFGRVFKMTGAETPDVFTAMFDYDTYIATWSLNYTNRYRNGWSILFQGDQGTMEVDGYGSRLWNEPWEPGKDPDWVHEGGLPTRPHVENFIECIASRTEPNAPVEVGHTAVCGPHLANVAWRNQRRAHLNPDATEVSFG